jgi:glycosyltransferase involved in cell wall biosynthesis
MRRILLLIKGLGLGGAERLLATGVRWRDEDRFSYHVAYLVPWKRDLVGDIERAGVPVVCLGGGAGWVTRLRQLVRTRGIELVHEHSPYPAAVARLALSGPVRHVYTEHNVWSRYRRPTYWGNLLTFGRSDHVFAVSDEVRRSIRYPAGLGFLRVPPLETLYHGLDPEDIEAWGPSDSVRAELGVPPESPLLGTVGSLSPKKDHETLLLAVRELSRMVPGLRVVIVGRGPLEDRLRSLAAKLEVRDVVIFAGFRQDAPRLAGGFDVFVLSSRYEGLPVALLEAMALGRPVVATAVGGTSEVLRDGRDGVLVPAGDPMALARALEKLLSEPAQRLRLGEGARRRAADFDIRSAVRRQEDVYGALLA